ncbi:YczE/YyaS/YitT family protein [Shimazuella alba]|uniref:YitT family protein n=1 Tax=Shimazuella alba TaxID=2690964 RepID=A0A6I4VSA5_9BACL|nr:hypothetical protein [Shimazuella alba]MXQ52690.1 hypothetical protein [Shimazuella alba]
MNQRWITYTLVVISTAVTAFGITLVLLAELGVDPISTFLLGGLNFVPIRFGTGSQIFSLTFLVINYFLNPKFFGIGSIIFSIGCGYFINLFLTMDLMAALPLQSIPNIFIALIGILIYGIGTGLFLFTKTGTGPLEGLMFFLSTRLNVTIKVTRMVIDGILVATGILLGGLYGFGTILCIFLIGPIIELSLRVFTFLGNSVKKVA